MRIIRPIDFDDSDLTSDVAITETEWVAGTYSTGALRYVGSDLYEVVASPSTADEPTFGASKSPPTWLKIGKINRFRMFSGIVSEKTESTGAPINVAIDSGQLVNAVAFFGVEASEITVTVTDDVDGLVYSHTASMVDNSAVVDGFTYCFEPIVRKEEVAFLNLPSYATAVVAAEISAGTDDVACGEMVLGTQTALGATMLSFSSGIRDYSRKEVNAFGDFEITRRRFSKFAEFDVLLRKAIAPSVLRVLADRRALPTVWIGSLQDPETIIYGFYTNHALLRVGPDHSELSLEIEGLT
jgi:hypothetical protein